MIRELKETVELMNSLSYEDRMKAEFWQAKIRYDRLHDYLVLVEQGFETLDPKEDLNLLNLQAKIMEIYLEVLKERAQLLGLKFYV